MRGSSEVQPDAFTAEDYRYRDELVRLLAVAQRDIDAHNAGPN